jgi:hypothetical protein
VLGANRFDDFEARPSRHLDVEQHRLRLEALHGGDRRRTVSRELDRCRGRELRDTIGDPLAGQRFIVGNEHARDHGTSVAPCTAMGDCAPQAWDDP